MLLLSGVRDEVVPKEHMLTLWEVVGKRQGSKTSEGRGEGEPKGDGQVGLGKSKFVQFSGGTHSKFRSMVVMLLSNNHSLN